MLFVRMDDADLQSRVQAGSDWQLTLVYDVSSFAGETHQLTIATRGGARIDDIRFSPAEPQPLLPTLSATAPDKQGMSVLTYTGILQSSYSLDGPWVDYWYPRVGGWVVVPTRTTENGFFRVRN